MFQTLPSAAILLVLCVFRSNAFLGDTIEESKWAKHVFHLVDTDGNGTLTLAEVQLIYTRFDLNGDGQVTAGEFIKHWLEDDVGDTASGYRMFQNVDTDKNGFFSQDPDLTRTFHHFDTDGDGFVSTLEFVLTWTKMSL
ncbi:insoluble matrix shell protein 5-like [Liolophura sinensis]|uniref:insoluble matrix shell protein 5-like n=1 Tax=Liolophura sinensis TaxID=3198878 RepID=UPI00315960DB